MNVDVKYFCQKVNIYALGGGSEGLICVKIYDFDGMYFKNPILY
jgi:hypothetical protein